MLAEALSLDVSELGERCGVYNDLSADAMAFALNTTKECTFKLERYPPCSLPFSSYLSSILSFCLSLFVWII